MEAIQYLIISTISLTVFYFVYRLLFRKETNFKQLRSYLLFSIFFSLFLPFNNFQLPISVATVSKIEKSSPENITNTRDEAIPKLQNTTDKNTETTTENLALEINWVSKIEIVYLSISIILLIRIVVQLIYLFYLSLNSTKLKSGKHILIFNKNLKSTFSFFYWIFINENSSDKKKLEKIILHEKIHAQQYHSFDILLIELLSAVMWFNPVVWMMRNSIQLVHEYLADEGVLNTGIDRLKYQALLINQVSEERLICLSSSFNHSLIKKRMIMMTNSKIYQRTNLKILFLIPVVTLLFLGISCVNAQNNSNSVTAVEAVRMNVLYLGIPNPIKIAASGYDAKDLEVSIDNGSITGEDGQYSVNTQKTGTATVTVSSKGKVIQETQFRVKRVPDPIATLNINGLKTGGEITKQELLDANGIKVMMLNFDFDLRFEIISFVVSTTPINSSTIIEEISSNRNYSENQKTLINSLIVNQKVIIEEIKAVGPDGSTRKLSPMIFRIIE